MKKLHSESELNAQLRRLTGDVRQLREELRGSLREKRRSFKRALDESSRLGVPPKKKRPGE